MDKKDLTNVAYSQEYLNRRNEIIEKAFKPEYKTEEYENFDGDIKRIITPYLFENYYCSHNIVYENNIRLHEYFSIYNHPFFCTKINFSNGKKYLCYKEDLYGYSVFEIETNKVFNYYPAKSLNGDDRETFIGTDIHYNPLNNIVAVGGCYWACPSDVYLFKIDDPLKEFTEYADVHLLIDAEYDDYDDIDFVEWQNKDIKLKCFQNEGEKIVLLKEEEYKTKMKKIME
jgi:hypothetical protein